MKIAGISPFPVQSQKRLDPDFGQQPQDDGPSDSVRLGAAAAWVGLTGAAGAWLGHQRQMADQITVEHRPYPEMRSVPVGTHEQHGCYQYHYGYDMMKSEWGFHYGYDTSCRKTVTDYVQEPTGQTLIQNIEHHSLGFPNTVAQGALLGVGLGVVTGAAGLVLAHVLEDR